MKARSFPFYVEAAANSRSSVVTPTLRGPLLLTRCHFLITPVQATPLGACIELSLNGSSELNVPIGNIKQQTIPFFEPQYDPGVPTQPPHPNQIGVFNPGTFEQRPMRMKAPIILDSVNIMVALLNNGNVLKTMVGYLRVWEDVPKDMLVCWLD